MPGHGGKGHRLVRPASDRQARWLGLIAAAGITSGISERKAKDVLRGYHKDEHGRRK